MSDRGEYRSFYVAIADDPDAHALSDRAWRVLTLLKLSLPATGIGVVYNAMLAERCRCTAEELEAAYRELEAPKPESGYGWILRERNIVWLVNGLRFEPNLSAENVQKHRPFVERLVNQLGEKPAIVRRFKAYYREWFPEAAPGTPSESPRDANAKGTDTLSGNPTDTLSEGNGKATDSVSKHIDQTSLDVAVHHTKRNQGEERAAAPAPATASTPGLRVVSPAAPRGERRKLPDAARRLVCAAYGWNGTAKLTARQRAVTDQLLALSGDGVPYDGAKVRAVDDAHLAWACEQVLARLPEDRDVAIQWVILKLRDTYTEVVAERSRRVLEAEEAESDADVRAAERWAAVHPDAWEPIRRAVEARQPGAERTATGKAVLAVELRTALLQAWREATAGDETAESERAPPELAATG